MAKKDKRIDAYITKAKPFAQPILKRLRKLVHQACPQVEENIKWGFASFDYKGPFVTMAAFKEHAVFGFWKFKLIKDPKGYLGERANQGGEAMGNLGRVTSLKDLPPDRALIDFIKQAKKLNDKGIKLPSKPKPKVVKEMSTPLYFLTELKKNKKAFANWEVFTYGKKKEYLEWITGAKTLETRNSRMATAVEWISENKIRNWKYVR